MIDIHKITGRMGNLMFQWSFLYALCREGQIPDTYVQDFKYFDKYRNELREIFHEGITSVPYVGIHCRRGDYAGNTFHSDMSKTDYYERAMALFPGANFKVFSDDIQWCRGQERFKGCEFSTNTTELEDFNELASCMDGIIIANSSFSFWTAYLSNAKKIVMPKENTWFRDGVERVTCPPEWIRV